MEVKENAVEKKEKNLIIKEEKSLKTIKKTKADVFVIFGILFLIVVTILLVIGVIFTYFNMNSDKIHTGVYIKGIDVSELTRQQATEKINEYIINNIPEEIHLKSNDYDMALSTKELNISFNVNDAVDVAYGLGRKGNIFESNFNIIKAYFSKINIEPILIVDKDALKNNLEEMSKNLPDKVIESSYYIEGSNLIITKGKEGYVIDIDQMIEYIINEIQEFNLVNNVLEIKKIAKTPEIINIDNIYSEVHKEAKDAHYTQEPFTIYPCENGIDFNISIDDAKNLLKEEKEEYSIPLKVLYPKITTDMIGTEAFPDLLSNFSTKYAASNRNRTTNLILASNKINGTVLMPGDTFSYNKVVGERTIAAGYKEAAIYVSGEVVDGLGGGICQIATTLYNAAVYANLEIVERRNHQFVPSYVGASRDATVVYGAIDFKFKNNRNYPIKIVSSVSGGIANFKIYGLKTDNEYEVEITSKVTSSTANSLNSQAYKTLKQNGKVVKSELLSKDTYKKH